MSMQCSDIERLWRAGELPRRLEDAEVRAHLAQCAGCADLCAEDARLFGVLGQPPEADLSAMRERLQRALEEEDESWIGRCRALSTRRRRALLIGGGLALVSVVFLAWPRGDLGSYPWTRSLGLFGVFILTAGWAAYESLRPLHQRSVQGRRALIAATGLSVPVIGALLRQPHSVQAGEVSVEHQVLEALPCMGLGLGVAGLVLLAWKLLDRRAGAGLLEMALLAALGVTFANAALEVFCTDTRPGHALLGHAGVGLVLVVLLLAGRRWRGDRTARV